jgi:uncharacterized membrane protein
MGKLFWVRRYLTVFGLALVVIAASHLVRGRPLSYAATEALLWAAITASVFTAARIYQSRRGQHCAVCRDTPEFHNPTAPSPTPTSS